jgi:membrane-bound inhibitor of C-type lysozyme
MRVLIAIFACAALSACATPAQSGAGPQQQWRCNGGAAFSLHMTSNGAAEVFAGGQTYTLPAVQSADGNRFSNGAVEYWEKGDSAMLNGARGGPYADCHH